METQYTLPATTIEWLYKHDDATLETISHHEFKMIDDSLHELLQLVTLASTDSLTEAQQTTNDIDETISLRDGIIHMDGYTKGFKMAMAMMRGEL